MFSLHFSFIFNGLDVVRLFIWKDFGSDILGVWGGEMAQKRQSIDKTLAVRSLSTLSQVASFEPLCVKLSIRLVGNEMIAPLDICPSGRLPVMRETFARQSFARHVKDVCPSRRKKCWKLEREKYYI